MSGGGLVGEGCRIGVGFEDEGEMERGGRGESRRRERNRM